jgi:hypothetical protein
MAIDLFLTRRQLLLQKSETTYGVDPVPSHSNSYDSLRLVAPFTLDLAEDLIETQGGNLSRGRGRPFPSIKRSGVTFRTYVQGVDTASYSASVKPPIADCIRACGFFETLVSSGPDIPTGTPYYKYACTNDVGSDNSITIYAHQDGKEHRFVGCRGNVNFVFAADAPVIAEFNFRGLLSAELETTRSAPVGFPTNTPPQWIDSGSIIVGSYAIPVENLNLNTNNTIFEEPASVAKSASGIINVIITQRAPGGSWDPEATFSNTLDFFSAWRSASGTILRLNAGITQGNRFTIVASQMVFKKVGWGDKSGLSIFSTDYELYERSSDDQMILLFS